MNLELGPPYDSSFSPDCLTNLLAKVLLYLLVEMNKYIYY